MTLMKLGQEDEEETLRQAKPGSHHRIPLDSSSPESLSPTVK